MGKYKITYQGKEVEVERLPNGKFKIPPLGQFTKQGLGSTWLDDCRIPIDKNDPLQTAVYIGSNPGSEGLNMGEGWRNKGKDVPMVNTSGRFPANLICSDDVLNDGRDFKKGGSIRSAGKRNNQVYGEDRRPRGDWDSYGDSGSFSRYFDLDSWAQKTFPFAIISKASKSEKNKGCEDLYWEKVAQDYVGINRERWLELGIEEERIYKETGNRVSLRAWGNIHSTVKPLKLMSYLITLGSRNGDTVIDPFSGSGTTLLACQLLNRKCIGLEIEESYCEIAAKRCSQGVFELNV